MIDFIKLPNKLFYTNDNSQSILQIVNDPKVILVMEYLYINTNGLGVTKFTLKEIITKCGFKINRNKNKTNDQFKNILIKLQELKIITKTDANFKSIKINQIIECNVKLIEDKESFTIMWLKEKEIILRQDIEEIDNVKLLIYFMYIKSRIKRHEDETHNKMIDNKNPEVAYPSFKTITKDLGISDKTIKKYNDILEKLNLIRIGNAGTYYIENDPKKTPKESVNIYALVPIDIDLPEKDKISIADYNIKNQLEIILDNPKYKSRIYTPYKNQNYILNGKYGSLKKKEKLGTITPEENAEMLEMIESKKKRSDYIYLIKELINKNPNKLISEIYFDNGDIAKGNEYAEIEKDLKLVDERKKLIIDFEGYKWAMINYYKEDVLKIERYIKKHRIINAIKIKKSEKHDTDNYYDCLLSELTSNFEEIEKQIIKRLEKLKTDKYSYKEIYEKIIEEEAYMEKVKAYPDKSTLLKFNIFMKGIIEKIKSDDEQYEEMNNNDISIDSTNSNQITLTEQNTSISQGDKEQLNNLKMMNTQDYMQLFKDNDNAKKIYTKILKPFKDDNVLIAGFTKQDMINFKLAYQAIETLNR